MSLSITNLPPFAGKPAPTSKLQHFADTVLTGADMVCDYVPGISTISNLADVGLKLTVVSKNPSSRYCKRLQKKHYGRCAMLLFPLIGNIVIGCKDLSKLRKYHHSRVQVAAASTEVQIDLFVPLYERLQTKTEKLLENCDCLTQVGDGREVLGRYPNVLCPRKTAVMVNKQYIHANYITCDANNTDLVASQVPDIKCRHLFWTFVMEGGYQIIDLRSYNPASECYYPKTINQTEQYEDITVTLLTQEKTPTAITSTYNVQNTSGTSSTMTRYHYTAWGDQNPLPLLELDGLVAQLGSRDKVVVHCSAGVGRTGTLITAYLLKKKIDLGGITQQNVGSQLVDLIFSLRQQRGTKFVFTEGQFDSLLEYGRQLLFNNVVS